MSLPLDPPALGSEYAFNGTAVLASPDQTGNDKFFLYPDPYDI